VLLQQGSLMPSDALLAVAKQLNDPWLTDHVSKGAATAKQAGLSDVEALRSYGDKKAARRQDHLLRLLVRRGVRRVGRDALRAAP